MPSRRSAPRDPGWCAIYPNGDSRALMPFRSAYEACATPPALPTARPLSSAVGQRPLEQGPAPAMLREISPSNSDRFASR